MLITTVSSMQASMAWHTVVTNFHEVDARPGTDLSTENGTNAIPPCEVAERSNVHGESATVREVLNPPGPLSLGPR